MVKITFLGAGSTVFVRNVIGDCMCGDVLDNSEIALYDIDKQRLEDSAFILSKLNQTMGKNLKIKTYLGSEQRQQALQGANFVINAVNVGGYDPCTITDFEIPKKYGLRQTIADTLGIGGIMRALRTIPVLEEFSWDVEQMCPDAWFLNYTNPMGILTGYLQRYTNMKTIGLCHSVQVCAKELLTGVGMEDKLEGHKELIAGINHMGWLLMLRDKEGNDLYPEVRRRAKEINRTQKHKDMVRFDYIEKFGFYCTESSEHNAEYTPYYIKQRYPELIERFQIPLDEYPRRCLRQIERWAKQKAELETASVQPHTKSREYASSIMEAMVMNKPFEIGGNVINEGLIGNLPAKACVEVPCLIDGSGIHPCRVGDLPPQCAALNMTNVNVQLLTIEAAKTRKKEHIYHAALLDPHTAAELDIDTIVKMVDDFMEAHSKWLPEFR